MKKGFRIFSIIVLVLVLFGCGNKESATGGPKDTDNPEILNVYPPEYEDITGKDIEIVFSKPMDYTSLANGLRIFPEIIAKRYRWQDNTLIIKINEELLPNTNYLFSFSDKIKCYHDNPLDQQYDFVWAHGILNDYKVSGSFSFEELEDSSEEVRLMLFTADTTLIITKNFKDQYSFDALNQEGHFIRAYIDKNNNQRLDIEKEPLAIEEVADQPVATVDLFLAYSDSTAPTLTKAKANYIDEFDLVFSENVTDVKSISVLSDSLRIPGEINRFRIKEKSLKVFCSNLDTLDYVVFVENAEDKKGNMAEIDSLSFEGITKIDSIPPKITKIVPRDGSSVTTLFPEISIEFNEVIFYEDIKAWLIETETKAKFNLEIIEADNEIITLHPLKKLNNFNTYRLHLEVSDPRGNIMEEFEGSSFLPIVKEALSDQ